MTNTAPPEATQLEFLALHTIKIRGFCTAEQVAESTGEDVAALDRQLVSMAERGEVKFKSGRITGYMLTAAGRARLTDLRPLIVLPDELAALTPAYQAFLAPNAEFKQLTTDAQLAVTDGVTDDQIARLDALHAQASEVLAVATAAVSRFGHYQGRLERPLSAYRGGDPTALAKPMTGSYHDVWMELHEDFVSTLGHQRTEADG